MIGHIVVVVEGQVELALGLAVVGISPALAGGDHLVDATEDQNGLAAVLHGVQRTQGNRVVNLVGSIAGLERLHTERHGLAVFFDDAKGRVGNHYINAVFFGKLDVGHHSGVGGVPLSDLEAMRFQVRRAARIKLVGIDLRRVCREDQRAIASRRLIDCGVDRDPGKPLRQIAERYRRRIGLIANRGGGAG